MLEICKTAGLFCIPLGVLALLGFVFFLERFIFLHKGRIYPEKFLCGVENLVETSRLTEALTLCNGTPGPVARLVKVCLLNFSKDADSLLCILRQNAILELPILQKHVESIRLIGQLAPVVGLIGSVFFLLKGFWVLGTLQAYTNFMGISPYIVSAISVTLLGLLELFIFSIAYHFLMGRIRVLIFDMEWCVQALLSLHQQTRNGPDKNS